MRDKVHLKNGKIRYIEGNRNHPVNKGVLCAKGSAGIMQHYSPARLTKPLKRIGERGSGEFKEIEWDEALQLATSWLSNIRQTDPKSWLFYWARSEPRINWVLGQPVWNSNHAAHGGFLFCKHGSSWSLYHWRIFLGVWRAKRLGAYKIFYNVWRRRGP